MANFRVILLSFCTLLAATDNHGESQNGTDGGGSGDVSSEKKGELSDDVSDGEGVCESRERVRTLCGSKSSGYSYLVSSPDCCRTYSDSCFSVLYCARHGYPLQLNVC